jgi:hypothetical protein
MVTSLINGRTSKESIDDSYPALPTIAHAFGSQFIIHSFDKIPIHMMHMRMLKQYVYLLHLVVIISQKQTNKKIQGLGWQSSSSGRALA